MVIERDLKLSAVLSVDVELREGAVGVAAAPLKLALGGSTVATAISADGNLAALEARRSWIVAIEDAS